MGILKCPWFRCIALHPYLFTATWSSVISIHTYQETVNTFKNDVSSYSKRFFDLRKTSLSPETMSSMMIQDGRKYKYFGYTNRYFVIVFFFFVFCFFLYCFQPQLRHLIKFLSAIFNKICLQYICLVDWDCKIHRLLLCTEIRHPADECPGYNIKQSDGEIPVKLEFGGMRSTPSLSSLPGPLLPGMVAPHRALFMG